MKHLGEKPPRTTGSYISQAHLLVCYREEKEHYRQALIEAADELENNATCRCGGSIMRPCKVCQVIDLIRISAGVKEAGK
jgi:hypothetical protein